MMRDIEYLEFIQINLLDPFFDSLKVDYPGFEKWFEKKSSERAFVHFDECQNIDGFLYLKLEEEAITDIEPCDLPKKRRLKVGTFKVNARGTQFGDRFMGKILQTAFKSDVEEIYVTIFPKHEKLIQLVEKYKFESRAKKKLPSGDNGHEEYFFRNIK